jgi:hypothetical protein
MSKLKLIVVHGEKEEVEGIIKYLVETGVISKFPNTVSATDEIDSSSSTEIQLEQKPKSKKKKVSRKRVKVEPTEEFTEEPDEESNEELSEDPESVDNSNFVEDEVLMTATKFSVFFRRLYELGITTVEDAKEFSGKHKEHFPLLVKSESRYPGQLMTRIERTYLTLVTEPLS